MLDSGRWSHGLWMAMDGRRTRQGRNDTSLTQKQIFECWIYTGRSKQGRGRKCPHTIIPNIQLVYQRQRRIKAASGRIQSFELRTHTNISEPRASYASRGHILPHRMHKEHLMTQIGNTFPFQNDRFPKRSSSPPFISHGGLVTSCRCHIRFMSVILPLFPPITYYYSNNLKHYCIWSN